MLGWPLCCDSWLYITPRIPTTCSAFALPKAWPISAKALWRCVRTTVTGSWCARQLSLACYHSSCHVWMSRTVSRSTQLLPVNRIWLVHATRFFVQQQVYMHVTKSSKRNAACAVASSFTFCFAVILGKSHYIMFNLVTAMQPRMLVTFDEELRPLPVSVRVGQVRKHSHHCSLTLTHLLHGEEGLLTEFSL